MMATAIKAVLFDYGLVLTGPPRAEAWQRMIDTLSVDEAVFNAAYWEFRQNYDRGTLEGEAYWNAVAQLCGRELDERDTKVLVHLDTLLWTEVNQPMMDWAMRLRAAGTRTGILSNLGDRMMEGVLERLDWMRGFDHSTFSHTVRLVKPDPGIYRHAAEGLGVPPASILFVDDREENVRGAEKAGMQAIQYASHEAFLREMQHRGLMQLWEHGLP